VRLIASGFARIRDERRSAIVLTMCAVITAQVEALALVIVGLTIEGFAESARSIELSVGPFSADLGILEAVTTAFVLLLVGAGLTLLYLRIQIRTAARIDRRYRDRLAIAFSAADLECQVSQRSGRLSGLLHRTIAAPKLFSGVTSSIRALTMVVVFLVVAFIVSWQAALVTSVLGGALGAVLVPLRHRVKSAAQRHSSLELTYAEELSEAAEQAADLRVFGGWPAVQQRLTDVSSGIEQARRHLETITTAIPLAYQYGGPVIVVALMLLLPMVASGVSLGSLAVVAFLLLRVIQFSQILQVNQQLIVQSLVVVDQLGDELAALERSRTPRGQHSLESAQEFRLDHLHYRYPHAAGDALKEVNVSLRRGEVVGLVGPSGGGKSTLAQILLGLRFPTSGQLLVDGIEVTDYGDEAWQGHVVHVPQQPRLLHGTLMDNVAMLDQRVTRAQVSEALELVGLGGFVRGLPQQLDTQVGPSTRSLSGGQLQRLAIARALVRRPDAIVLDEPTSALDVDAERVVQDALTDLKGSSDALILVIAHRTSTLAMCDRIIVLEHGRIVADGVPEQVLIDSDFFSRAQQAQLVG
jgi:ABC-type multidrug transport system fused ATPase/permease subunit